MRISFAVLFIVSSLLFSACTKKMSAKASYKVGDCLYMKDTTDSQETYFKIVGMADGKYTIKSCSGKNLRSNEVETEKAMTADECFAENISQQSFADFEIRKDGRGDAIPLYPITCEEVK